MLWSTVSSTSYLWLRRAEPGVEPRPDLGVVLDPVRTSPSRHGVEPGNLRLWLSSSRYLHAGTLLLMFFQENLQMQHSVST